MSASGLLVALSLVLGFSYPLLWDHLPSEATAIALKGSGVGLLALAAASRARGVDGRLLALLLALGATGDVLLEVSLAAGASAFAVGHGVAILLYRRNRRPDSDQRDWAIAALILVVAAAVPGLLLQGRTEVVPFTAYALLLGAMAASAWLSRFPRGLVALGAILFLASDMLIALRMASDLSGLGAPIWLLYYAGQLMIFLGVTSALPPRGRGPGGVGPAKRAEG
ncbi:MAG TPA: lysoplasmalogenase family protein [Allosphingosinicella sp.]|nr:lysoplasmalogenase family protein [Allosphingosinicella sp.]